MKAPPLVEKVGREAIDTVISKRKAPIRFMRHDKWENALFVHWPVDPEVIEKLLPKDLVPDVLDGMAWVGLVLLTERGVSSHLEMVRRMHCIDHLGANVRTYVRRREGHGVGGSGDPGIYFFSLECSSIPAALGARVAGIPYFISDMTRSITQGNGWISTNTDPADLDGNQPARCTFSSCRASCWPFSRGTPDVQAKWHVKAPADASQSLPEEFEVRARWFVERYSVYAAFPLGKGPITLRGDVTHPKWPLQEVELEELDAVTLLVAAGLPATILSEEPHVCFSPGVGPVEFWMLEPL